MVADPGVMAVADIELDVFDDLSHRINIIVEQPSMHEFSLHGVKERFHSGIIERAAFTTHAARHARRFDQVAVFVGGIFNTLIGVEDAALGRHLARQGHP